MSPHFLIEYRTHFTKFHQLVVGGIGATEQLCLIMSIMSIGFVAPQGTAVLLWELFQVAGFSINGRDLVWIVSLATGL